MKRHKLDKLFDTDTEYRTEARTVYVIKKLGTNSSTEVTTKIDKKEVTHTIDVGGPLHTINSNLNKPMDLADLFLVVPPDTTLYFDSESTALVRALGDLYRLDVGEAMPSDLASRFKAQHNHYRTLIVGTATTVTNALADEGEDEVYEFAPSTPEKYLLRSLEMVEETVAGAPAETEGDIAVLHYLDDVPLDIESDTEGYLGVGRYSMPGPPAETTENIPFDRSNNPIEIAGDHKLSVRVRNVSGGALFGTTAAQYTYYAVADYTKFIA